LAKLTIVGGGIGGLIEGDDVGHPGWREHEVWRRRSLQLNRAGALDPPGATWRDRPCIDRGDGVWLVNDQVAAPGLLSEVTYAAAIHAVAACTVNRLRPTTRNPR
jgi:hypothetical protein